MMQRLHQVGLKALEAVHRIGEGVEPARFHQRFPGQAEQPVQILGGQPQHCAGRDFRLCGPETAKVSFGG